MNSRMDAAVDFNATVSITSAPSRHGMSFLFDLIFTVCTA